MVRDFLVVRPRATSPTPLSVIVFLHGRGGTPEAEMQQSGLTAMGPAILVYPAGYGASWNAGACCGDAQTQAVDDVSFISSVIDNVMQTQPDASNMSVLAGLSNGGRMTMRMACERPGRFRAFVTMEAAAVMNCPTPPVVPFLDIAGDADTYVTVSPSQPPIVVNGYTQRSVQEEVQSHVTANGCTGSATQRTVGSLTTWMWANCSSGAPVEMAIYHGLGHAWPDGDATTPSAQMVTWSFMDTLARGSRTG
jgi:polyhydroxybutyrate depolymerase